MLKAWYSKAEVLIHTCTKIFHAFKKKKIGAQELILAGFLYSMEVCHTILCVIQGMWRSLVETWALIIQCCGHSWIEESRSPSCYTFKSAWSPCSWYIVQGVTKNCAVDPSKLAQDLRAEHRFVSMSTFFFIKSFHQLSSVWLQFFNNRLVAVL